MRYTNPLSATAMATSPPPSRGSGVPRVPLPIRALARTNSTMVPTTTSPIG